MRHVAPSCWEIQADILGHTFLGCHQNAALKLFEVTYGLVGKEEIKLAVGPGVIATVVHKKGSEQASSWANTKSLDIRKMN